MHWAKTKISSGDPDAFYTPFAAMLSGMHAEITFQSQNKPPLTLFIECHEFLQIYKKKTTDIKGKWAKTLNKQFKKQLKWLST